MGCNMNIEDEIFKKSKPIISKLIKYGLKKINDIYIYETFINNNKFKVIIEIEDNNVIGKIIDLDLNKEYINFRIKKQNGEFVNSIRKEYEDVLIDIKNNCFEEELFIFKQTNRITSLIKDKYNVAPEFLWSSFPGYGVFRNKQNNKWFGIIANVDKSKIIKNKKGMVEVINVKLDNEVDKYLKINGIYPAYHMSKKSWVSIILDDTLTDKEIIELIDLSYQNINKN